VELPRVGDVALAVDAELIEILSFEKLRRLAQD
jgi:hypothetical protein